MQFQQEKVIAADEKLHERMHRQRKQDHTIRQKDSSSKSIRSFRNNQIYTCELFDNNRSL